VVAWRLVFPVLGLTGIKLHPSFLVAHRWLAQASWIDNAFQLFSGALLTLALLVSLIQLRGL
jgi:hypothetical protein